MKGKSEGRAKRKAAKRFDFITFIQQEKDGNRLDDDIARDKSQLHSMGVDCIQLIILKQSNDVQNS